MTRPAWQVLASAAAIDRALAAGLPDESAVALVAARSALRRGEPVPWSAELVAALADPAAVLLDETLVATLKSHRLSGARR